MYTAGQLCKFIVNTSKAGCSALAVNISGPSRVELISREVEQGYEFSYTPLAPGDYLIVVKYAGTHVPGSPFNAHIEGLSAGWNLCTNATYVLQEAYSLFVNFNVDGICFVLLCHYEMHSHNRPPVS